MKKAKMKRYSAANKYQAKVFVATIKSFGMKAEIDPTWTSSFYYEPNALPIIAEAAWKELVNR
tara:strand:+ start:354 stop:542 length:189 start_codon:yes stop_codon:yes gene_type:complete